MRGRQPARVGGVLDRMGFGVEEWSEEREFNGSCPVCGEPVRWRARYLEGRGAMPPGTPHCERCVGEAQVETRRRTYDEPMLQQLHEVGVHVPEYGRMTFSTWDDSEDAFQSQAREVVRAVVQRGDHAGLYLHGPNGNGKSALAVCTVRGCLERGVASRAMRFELVRRYLRKLAGAYRDGRAEALIERAGRARLLVLDELGQEPLTDHSAAILSEILDRRVGPTLVTTNLGVDELAMRYVDVDGMGAMISRLRGLEACTFRGRDRRGDGRRMGRAG